MNQCVDEMTPPLNTSDTTDSAKHPDVIVECRGSGKCVAKIRHPVCKVWVYVGTYSTPEEAGDACTRKKLEYESPSAQEEAASLRTNVADFEKHPGIRITRSGKWRAAITHNRVVVSLGTYNTPIEAADAYNLSKLELGSKIISSLRKEGGSIYREKSEKWKDAQEDTAEEAEEAYNNKRREFDLMVHSHKKCKQNEDDGFVARGGLDLGVVDSYGRFVGEYSRLDDELWLCRS